MSGTLERNKYLNRVQQAKSHMVKAELPERQSSSHEWDSGHHGIIGPVW